MNQSPGASSSPGSRFQWGSYGFFAGIALGIVIGWMFSGLVGAFVRVGLVLLIAIPVVLGFIAWRRYVAPLLQPPPRQRYVEPTGVIETHGVVRGAVREPNYR
jgi:hypothetical protein